MMVWSDRLLAQKGKIKEKIGLIEELSNHSLKISVLETNDRFCILGNAHAYFKTLVDGLEYHLKLRARQVCWVFIFPRQI